MLTTVIVLVTTVIIGLGGTLFWLFKSRDRARQGPPAQAELTGSPQPSVSPATSPPSARPLVPTINQEVENVWSGLAAQLPSAVVYDVNIESGQVRWNDAFYTAFGYDRNEPADTVEWLAARMHPDDAMRVNQTTDGLNQPEVKEWEVDYRFRMADDTYASVHDHAILLRGAQGEPLHIVGSLEKRQVTSAPNPSEPSVQP